MLCEEKYNKSKAVHSIMRHVSETHKIKLEELYQQFGWDLYKRFGHAYDAFKLIVAEPEKVLEPYKISPEVKGALLKNIARRLTPQPIKLRADIEVMCFGREGIQAIKEALKAGESLSDDEMQIKIKLVAPPLYVMMTTSLDKEAGIAKLQEACDLITKIIKSKDGGQVNLKSPPRAVSERDDRLLATLMETLEKQNQEVAGDEPEED